MAAMAQLTVMQTADLHNHIDLRKAGHLRNLRLEHDALLVDCGDAIWAGNLFIKPGPEHAIRRMNEAGYHAMALGNREYFFRALGMLTKTAEARFPVLSANLLPKSGNLGHVERWTIVESPRGDRVGLFGLTPLMIKPGAWPERLSNMRFISHIRATREAIHALRDSCEWIICLSHIGIERDYQIAQEFAEIDLILGGHTHEATDNLIAANGVHISHILPYGEHAAIIRSSGPDASGGFVRELAPLQ